MHTPVLLNDAIDGINVKSGGLYIDATFGEGGYTKEILDRGGKVLAIDLDKDQLKNLRNDASVDLKLVQGNFAEIESIARKNGFYPADGVVFDLGLSMRQLNESGRGLSFKKDDELLDMRLDLDTELTAEEIIKTASEKRLYEIFAGNSEELKSKEIAHEVAVRRPKTVRQLKRAIDTAIKGKSEAVYRRIFQALRIEVNSEFTNLRDGLYQALNIVRPGGRVVVVSFHSREDRIVKNIAREKNIKFLNKKPKFGEQKFERSAKLRILTV